MKCIYCESDSTYRQRSANGKRCTNCQHPFAFEPKTDTYSISDGLFRKCIQEVSAEGTLQFTSRQLYYEFARRVKSKMISVPAPYGWAAAGMGAGGVIGLCVGFPVLLPVGIVGAMITLGLGGNAAKKRPAPRVPRLSLHEFELRYLSAWLKTHGKITGLLPNVPTARGRVWTDAPLDPPDLTSYSFDRALIVDSAEVAAMLVANRFHFENNCAILSLDKRFPANGRFEQVRAMLHRNPRLIVFALHNASVEGMGTIAALRGAEWFPNPTIQIADLGLRPQHVLNTNMLLTRGEAQTLPPEIRATLDPKEATWLAEGFVAELEAMRPAKLMRAIYHAFSQMVTVGPDGHLILIDTGPGIWVGDGYPSGSGVYTADSFG